MQCFNYFIAGSLVVSSTKLSTKLIVNNNNEGSLPCAYPSTSSRNFFSSPFTDIWLIADPGDIARPSFSWFSWIYLSKVVEPSSTFSWTFRPNATFHGIHGLARYTFYGLIQTSSVRETLTVSWMHLSAVRPKHRNSSSPVSMRRKAWMPSRVSSTNDEWRNTTTSVKC